MNQAALFSAEELPDGVPEWRRIPGIGGGSCGARHVHRSGVVVAHCGHPTALRPYVVIGKWDELGCFPLLAQAKAAALGQPIPMRDGTFAPAIDPANRGPG